MKRLFPTLPFLFSFVLIVGAYCSVIWWKPTDTDAALAWNIAIMLAPAVALLAQWTFTRARQLPIVLTLTVVAILNTTIVLGARLGAWTGNDWLRALTGNGLPDLPGKTVMGGLMLMLVMYAVLQRRWRFSSAMADVLMLGLPLAATMGRVGCLVAGCCYGVPTGSDWGIGYGPGTPAYSHQLQAGILAEGASSTSLLFPIQLFFIAGNLFIFTILWHFRNKLTRPGALALLGLGLIAAQRFGLEFVRDVATNRGAFGLMWGGLKTGQWVLLLLAISSIAGFCALQFFRQKNTQPISPDSPTVGTARLAYTLGLITFGSFLLRDLMTLDETMVILISCSPAVLFLARQLWREYRSGRQVFAAASMLSATSLVLIINPVDTIPTRPAPTGWKQWIEVGAGGSFGSYKDIVRDCDGNVVRTDIIKVNSGGGEASYNWQRGRTKLQVALRGTFGTVQTDDNNYSEDNNHYASYGVQGGISTKWVGLSLGAFNRRSNFLAKVGLNHPSKDEFLPSGSLRIGLVDRYSVDFRLYDEPVLGFSNEPPFSIGLANWGFNDPSGNTFLRAGLAVSSTVQSAFHVSGQFPIGKTGLYGTAAANIGDANIFSLGLRYRFKER